MAVAQVNTEEKLITGEELYRTPDLERCELVEGRIIMLSPTGYRHSIIELRFGLALTAHVEDKQTGIVGVGEAGILVRRDPDTVRGADVFYISHGRYAQRKSTGFLDVAPELVVEILSPEDRWSYIMLKLGEYFQAGVMRVWVVDDSLRSVFVYKSLTEVQQFTGSSAVVDEELLPGFSLSLEKIFLE